MNASPAPGALRNAAPSDNCPTESVVPSGSEISRYRHGMSARLLGPRGQLWPQYKTLPQRILHGLRQSDSQYVLE